MGGAFFALGYLLKPTLSWDEQAALMVQRGLTVNDRPACAAFLAANSYYRFSGYARYFQVAPHLGDDTFWPGTHFDEVRLVYDADESLRAALAQPLACAELLLRSHTAHAIARTYGPSGKYLEVTFTSTLARVSARSSRACVTSRGARSVTSCAIRPRVDPLRTSAGCLFGPQWKPGPSERSPSASSEARRARWPTP